MKHTMVNTLQAARGIAAFMVVAFHLLPIEAKYGLPAMLPGAFYFGQLGVDVFFVISGFVMVLTTTNAHGSLGKSGQFIARRAARIYPLYWFYLLLLLPVFIVAPTMINASQGSEVDIVRSFLLFPDTHLPLLAVGWSLIYEVWFYLVFAVLLLAPLQVLPALLAAWAAVIVAASGVAMHSPVTGVIFGPYGLQFIAGAAGCLIMRRLSPAFGVPLALLGGILLVSVLYAWPTVPDSVTIYRAALIGIPVSMILTGASAAEVEGRISGAPWLKWAGDASYSIYLSHVLVLSVAGRVFAHIPGAAGTDAAGAIAFWAACVLLVTAGGIVSYRFIERPLITLARNLIIGQRARKTGLSVRM